MLRITTSQNNDLVELRVEGELTESTTHELEQLSRSYLGVGCKLVLRLAGVTFADRTGVDLLRSLEKKGVMLAECSGFFSELLHGKPESSMEPLTLRLGCLLWSDVSGPSQLGTLHSGLGCSQATC